MSDITDVEARFSVGQRVNFETWRVYTGEVVDVVYYRGLPQYVVNITGTATNFNCKIKDNEVFKMSLVENEYGA